MYPNLFGIDGFSMVVMILIGVIAATVLFFIYLSKAGVEKKSFLDLGVVITATAFMGIVFAILVENIYEAIKASVNGLIPHWTWAMTFYGGLLGGVATFILIYRFYYLRHNKPIFDEILRISPACIALGHGFGRIGCFLSGCCYGITTGTNWDIYFPALGEKHLPTHLFEMAFLFLLAALLAFFAFKHITDYTMIIYLASYATFRFIIEFFRGDERGQLAGLSPSQYWCIAIILLIVPLFFLLKYKFFKKEEKVDEVSSN